MVTTQSDIWYEKYRPQNIDDLILPDFLKAKLKEFIDKPFHLLLASTTPGTGKTSTVNALIKEGGFEALFINASLDTGIDILRSKVQQFASTESVNGKDKLVILDEFDFMNANSAQPALRGMLEAFSNNCKFIITCNYLSKVIPPIVNRCCVFNYDKIWDDMKTMIPPMFERLNFILKNENINYKPEDIQQVIKACYPSFRDAIGTLQKSTYGNELKVEIDIQAEFGAILDAMKSKIYDNVVKSVYGIANIDGFYSWLFNYANKQPSANTNPMLYVTLAKYQYQHSFARDPKLNLVACCVEIMSQSQI